MPKVVYTETNGLYQATGTGIQLETTPFTPIQTITDTATVDAPGVYLLNKSGGDIRINMPTAASVPGGVFVFRQANASPRQHFLTGSQEASGTKVFAGLLGAIPANRGGKLTFPALQNSSVTLISDGVSFCVMAASGSMTLSQ